MKFLNSFTLKIIAIISMLMDHIYTYVGRNPEIQVPIWFAYIGRLAAPIFFFLIVEGLFHTSNRKKYITRLFIFGALMIFIDLLLGIHNNIFLSLGLSVSFMTLFEYGKSQEKASSKKILFIALSFIVLSLELFTEASMYGVAMTLIFYFLRNKKVWMTIAYMLFYIFPVIPSLSLGNHFLESIFIWDYMWMSLFAIIPILMYSGKQGLKNKFTKWMFYIFYPAHLIIVVLIGKLI